MVETYIQIICDRCGYVERVDPNTRVSQYKSESPLWLDTPYTKDICHRCREDYRLYTKIKQQLTTKFFKGE